MSEKKMEDVEELKAVFETLSTQIPKMIRGIIDSFFSPEAGTRMGKAVAEFYKNFVHRGEQPRLYFWRDVKGHEVDVIIDLADPMIPVETKSGQTVASDFFDNIEYWRKASGDEAAHAALIYGGDQAFKRSGIAVYPWYVL